MPNEPFRLTSIVKLRERQRDTAAGAYREALAAKAKLQTQVAALMDEHAAQIPLQTSSSAGQVNTQRLIESQRYQLYLMQQVKGIESQIELVEAECEKRRLLLVQREQALSSLEKLRENQQVEWDAQQLNREQETLDHWGSFVHWKKSKGQ